MKKIIILSAMVTALTACSGLDNPCNDQGGGHCASVTTAYQNSLKDTVNPTDLPRGQSSTGSTSYSGSSDDSDLVVAYNKQQSYSQIPQAGDALRSAPKSMRIWLLPYEDDVGLYHDQQYVYALVEKGVWKYKSTSLKTSQNPYVNTYAGKITSSNYQPFAAKESDPISSNQSLISSVNPAGSPFSAQSIATKNTAAINSIGTPQTSSTSGN